MAGPVVRVQGARELRATLRRAGHGLEDLKDANAKAGRMVAQWAGVRAPRRTGTLGATVRAVRAVGKAQILAGSAAVPYAGPIHWGWPARGIRAQPWMSLAAIDTEPAWLPIYQHDIQQILDTVRGSVR